MKKNLKKEKCDFLKIFFLWIFNLSGLVIVHTASLLAEEHSKSILWSNFVQQQVFDVDSFYISLWVRGGQP